MILDCFELECGLDLVVVDFGVALFVVVPLVAVADWMSGVVMSGVAGVSGGRESETSLVLAVDPFGLELGEGVGCSMKSNCSSSGGGDVVDLEGELSVRSCACVWRYVHAAGVLLIFWMMLLTGL